MNVIPRDIDIFYYDGFIYSTLRIFIEQLERFCVILKVTSSYLFDRCRQLFYSWDVVHSAVIARCLSVR